MPRKPKSQTAAPPAAPAAPAGGQFPGNPFGGAPTAQPGANPFGQVPQQPAGNGVPQQGQPSPFGAPPTAQPPASPFGAPGSVAPGQAPVTGIASLPGAQVNQGTVQAAMQTAGAGVGTDPATSQAIVAIGGSLKDLEGHVKDLQSKQTGALTAMGQTLVEINKKLDSLLAANMSQQQAAAPPAPTPQPQAAPAAAPAAPAVQPPAGGDLTAALMAIRTAVQAKYNEAAAAGQPTQFRADQQGTWVAMAQVATQAGHQITPEQVYNAYQQGGLISAPQALPDGTQGTFVLP